MNTVLVNQDIHTDFAFVAASMQTLPVVEIFVPILPEPVSFEVLEGSTLVTTLTGFDVDGDPLIWSIVGGEDADLFSLDAATGMLTFNTAPDFEAPKDAGLDNDYFLDIKMSDGVNVTEREVLVRVHNVSETSYPTAIDDTGTMSWGSAGRNFDVLANDADPNDGRVFLVDVQSIILAAGQASINPDQTVRFDPAPGFEGGAIIEYVMRYDQGDTDLATLTVTVVDNFAPVIAEPVTFTIETGETLAANLVGFDLEADPLTWSIAGGPDAALFSVDPMTGVLTFNTAPDVDAPLDVDADNDYNLTVRLSDEFGYAEQPILVTVDCFDCPPEPNWIFIDPDIDPDTDPGGGPFEFFMAADTFGDLVTITASSSNSSPLEYYLFGEDANLFTLDQVTGQLSLSQALPGITGSFDTDGVYELTGLISDGDFASETLDIVLPLITSA